MHMIIIHDAYYLRANYATSRYCCVCVSVCLPAQNLKNYWSEIAEA